MVAARGRFTALWFVALMVSATFIGIAPTAAAAISGSAVIQFSDGSAISRTVNSNDVIKVVITGTTTACTGIGAAMPTSMSGIVESGVVAATDKTVTMTPDASGAFTGEVVIDVESELWDSAALRKLDVTLDATCGVGQTEPDPVTFETTTSIRIDNKAPAIAATPFTISYPASAPHVNVGGSIVGIGAQLGFRVYANDTHGVQNMSVDRAAIDGTLGGATTNASLVTLTVGASGANGVTAADGTGNHIVLWARDQNGNLGATALSFNLDNTAPGTALTSSTSYLDVTPTTARLQLFATPATADADITHAAVYRSGTLVGAATITSGSVSFASTAFGDDLGITIRPVDGAGNVNTALSHALEFPVANMSYGPNGDSPDVLADRNFGNVYVMVHENGPAVQPQPVSDTSPPRLYGQLLREAVVAASATSSTPSTLYWVNGTSGATVFATSNAHFQATPSLQNATGTLNTYTTVFQPAGAINEDTLLVLSNLTPGSNPTRTRDFEDGRYTLKLSVKNAGQNDNMLNLSRSFVVDATGPTNGGSRNYTNQLGANMTQVHGADGNPLQLHINVSDLRRLNSATTFPRTETPQDSGLAYVHVEFIDFETGQTARLADPSLTGDAALARVNISPSNVETQFPYFHDWASPPSVSACPTDPEACVYQQYTMGRWGASFVNGSWISGWVNTTFPDLPTGNYSIRVTGYDNAGRAQAARQFLNGETTRYVVAPIVRLDPASPPRVRADGGLDVSVQASKLSLNADSQACTGNVCPAESIIVWVANDISNGKIYTQRQLGRSPEAGSALPGFTGGYEPAVGGNLSGALAFSTSAIPTTYYRYTSGVTPDPLTNLGLNPNADVYVRAEAVATRADGSKVTRFTDWIKAVSASAPALNISQPAYDWQFNLTTLSGHATPPYYVQFDRRGEDVAPKMAYTITSVANDSVYASVQNLAPEGTNPRFLYNWSGALKDIANNSALYPGAYRFRATVYDNIASPLATADRYFIVNKTRPEVIIPTTQTGYGLVPSTTPDLYVAGTNFELTFRVDHGYVDLTSLDNVTFALLRETASGTQGTLLREGQEGFEVNLRAETPLSDSASITQFTANITLPTNRPQDNNAIFRIYITAALDRAPYVVGNTTRFIDVLYDREAPTGRLNANETIATVYDLDEVNPHKNLDPVAPEFRGFARDTGAGLDKVELRITDLTRNATLNFSVSGGVEMIDPEDPDGRGEWISNRTSVVAVTPIATGEWLWRLPLTSRGTFPDLYKAGDEADSSRYKFNLSHTYRVEVRFTDKLGQVQQGETVEFDWDASAPDLAYGNFLASASAGRPSGIHATFDHAPNTVYWQAEDDDTSFRVVATDNHCLADVRILGRSDANPDRIVSASMRSTEGSRVCPNGRPVNYTLDLEDAPELTSDVGMWTYWFSATDWANQTTEIPSSFRTMRVNVVDVTPALITNVTLDPPVGQAGGRSLIRANVFDNVAVDRVEVVFVDPNSTSTVLGSGAMRPVNATETVGLWVLDTTEDMGLDLEVRDYRVRVTAYDVNWNRSAALGGPTCEDNVCDPYLGGFLYQVRDDGIPDVTLESPNANNATVNATPTIKLRALHKLMETSSITVRVTTDGDAANLSIVPAAQLAFVELKAANGARQGWTVEYTPATPLNDNTTLLVNISASAGGIVAAQTYTFRVDAVGPVATANVTGTRVFANKTFATSGTRVTLTAEDSVSTTTILYRVGTGNPITYSGPLTPTGVEGDWTLEYWAVDTANNIGAKKTLTLALDLAGPSINVAQHGDTVLLTVNDNGSGVNESTVTVHYRYGATTTFSTLTAEKVTSNSFRATLPGNASESGLSYYFTAQDNLGQAGSAYSAAQPYTIGEDNATPSNLPPTIRITAPVSGASVGSLVDLKWLAEDPEGAPLSISIALRDPAPGRVLSAGGENSGTFRVNLSGLSAGAYTLVVTATDGENSASAQVSFNLESGKAIQPQTVPPATVQPNTQVSIAVAIQPAGKTVAQATYRLMRDGELATQGRLAPSQGLYAAGFTPTESGEYTVFVDVLYTDGSTEPSTQVAAFSVPSDGDDGGSVARGVFPTSLMALVAVALLTVALAAYGAFGRWKK